MAAAPTFADPPAEGAALGTETTEAIAALWPLDHAQGRAPAVRPTVPVTGMEIRAAPEDDNRWRFLAARPSLSPSSDQTGNAGNGFARIMLLQSSFKVQYELLWLDYV
jgi:hypothetical protein